MNVLSDDEARMQECARFVPRTSLMKAGHAWALRWLTAVCSEALVAEFAQAFEAVVDVPHFLLQVRVLLVQLGLFGVPLQWGDHVLVDFCRG